MNCFDNEIEKTVNDIKSVTEDGDLCFCLLSDSHMSDEGDDTCRNISAVDKEVGFDFFVHLGNVINGTNPQKISERILISELNKFKNSIKSRKLFVTQGCTDGWRDETFEGQLAQFIMTNEAWYDCTGFIDLFQGVSRAENMPYYYVDIPDKNIRLIFLCSYCYQIDSELGLYEKYVGIDVRQQGWLKTSALKGCKGKKVLIFSHKIPKSRFETGEDPYVYEGYSTEAVTAILQRARNNGVDIECWFGAGYGYDGKANVAGINMVVTGSQLARYQNTSKHSHACFLQERNIGTVNQDLWNAIVVKQNVKKIYLFRFGAGRDMTIAEI